MSFPALDLQGFLRKTVMPREYVLQIEAREPGYVAEQIADISDQIYARLRKRYGQSASGSGNSIPFGQNPPVLVASGTTPPVVTLVGTPTLGSMEVILTVTTPGPLGTALFAWSSNRGITTSAPIATGALVPLPGTGLSAVFTAGSYAGDNVYAAGPPVPRTFLRWLTAIVTCACIDKHGNNSNDPFNAAQEKKADAAWADIKEAADSKDGLWDLPVHEDADTAITTGGPLGCSQQSPYVWTDLQAQQARGGRL